MYYFVQIINDMQPNFAVAYDVLGPTIFEITWIFIQLDCIYKDQMILTKKKTEKGGPTALFHKKSVKLRSDHSSS